MKRKCKECSAPLRGRSDKKFCDEVCRNTYNNRENRHFNNKIRRINSILAKNRKILDELNPAGTSTTTKDILIGKKFNFDYFTNIRKTADGRVYYFIYDQGFRIIDHREVSLIDMDKYKSKAKLQVFNE